MTTSTDRPPTQGHRPVPNITEEVDRPFSYDRCSSNTDENLSKRLEVNRELHSMSIDNFKHILSQNLLKWCIIGTVVFAIGDAVFSIESQLYKSAYEMLKLVCMTALGYLFGSKKSS